LVFGAPNASVFSHPELKKGLAWPLPAGLSVEAMPEALDSTTTDLVEGPAFRERIHRKARKGHQAEVP
jgi:hypothetical protein